MIKLVCLGGSNEQENHSAVTRG